jgi:SAM-dependent methyltransferase
MTIPQIFNRKKVTMHRERAARNLSSHDFLLNEVADRILERLDDINREFPDVLLVGASPELSLSMQQRAGTNRLVNLDLSQKMLELCVGEKIIAEDETIPFEPNTFDLVMSNLVLHSVNDLVGALVQIQRLLKADGLFTASLYGEGTLAELRHIMTEVEVGMTGGMSPRIAPFADVKSLGYLLQRAGFALPVADSEIIKVSYDNVLELMHDLRGMGESNSLQKHGKQLTGELLAAMDVAYKSQYGDGEGGIIATFNIISITGLAAISNK